MRLKQNARASRALVHAAAFLLPALGLAATWAVIGIHPFGDWSVLAIDMRNQYVSYFAYLRDSLLLGGESWLYTFSKALGGDLAGLTSFYLLSPSNLLLLLFPTHALADGIALVTIAKVGCSGLTMSILLNRDAPRFASLLFSVPFALMDFNTAFQQNIMWLDGIILLPLVVLGIEKLQEGRGPWLYVLSLAGAIITCYYIGYIICVFSLLYFWVSYFCFHGHAARDLRHKAGWMPVGRFAAGSLLAGGLSAAVLLPGLLSLRGGKNTISLANLAGEGAATLPGVLSRYLPGTISMDTIFYGYPHIYCGMLAVVCAVLYLLNTEVERRRRVGAGLLIGVVLVSFCVPPVNIAWQAFNKPTGFLFRYSFLFSFALLCAGWQGFLHLRKGAQTHKLPYVLAGACLLILLIWRDSYTYMTTGKVLLGMALLAACTVLLWLLSHRKFKYTVLLLLIVVLADMGADLYLGLRRMVYFPYDYYADFVKRNAPVIEAVKQKDQSFYRMEMTDTFSDNDALLFGYRGLTHYSSTDKLAVRHFLDHMGFSEGTHSVKYSGGSTAAADNLLGLRYLLTRGDPHKPYELQGEESGIQTWYNPQALPLGFMVRPSAIKELEAEENLFSTHNKLWRELVPALGEDLYRPASKQAEITMMNLSVKDFYGEEHYEKIDPEADAWLELRVPVESDDTLCMLLTSENYKGARFYLNGEHILSDYLTDNKHGIYSLGRYAPGSEAVVRLEPQGSEILIKNRWFYHESRALLSQAVDDLKTAVFDPDVFDNAMLSGRVSNPGGEKTMLLVTVPYDAGWTAELDGEPTKISHALGALMAIEVPPGEHALRLSYTPPGLWLGVGVTAGSLLALVLWWLWRRHRGAGRAAAAALPRDYDAEVDEALQLLQKRPRRPRDKALAAPPDEVIYTVEVPAGAVTPAQPAHKPGAAADVTTDEA